MFYQGTTPGDADNWNLAARYFIGRPLGYNAFIEVDNDTWIITEAGIVPISLLFSGGPTVAQNAVSRKVNPLLQQYAQSVGFSALWRGMYWPQGKRVYVQVPRSASATFLLVCNIETGAWCIYDYTGIETISMALLSGVPYFGKSTGGVVYEAEQATSDDGAAIEYDMDLPFTFFGDRQSWKRFLDIRPLMFTESGVTVEVAMNTDFTEGATTKALPLGSSSGMLTLWDEADWDTSDWGSEGEYFFDRYGLSGQGHSGSLRVTGQVTDQVLKFTNFEIRFESGGQV